ncbi:MAG: deoxyribonuclease V [Thermodesulfobacteriota bacterium]|nr:deoxyribonuclease V [Thermodesulfobacteriota bacterium]
MKIRRLHPWKLQYKEAVAVQRRLSGQIREKALPRPIDTIAGADASYHPQGRKVHGAVLVFTFPDLVLTDRALASDTTSFPYVSGLLSFREAPVLEKAFSKLGTKPDVMIFDGQGIAHPRGMGLASHMGLILDAPTIGCAKTRLVGSYPPPGQAKGSTAPLDYRGRIVGAVVRTRAGVKPVFVSPGHAITLAEAIGLVLDCSGGYRLPEPLRQAHLTVNRYRLEAEGSLERVKG